MKEDNEDPPWWRSTRYLLAVLASFGYGNFFFQRIDLSMAIVCMVNTTAVDIVTSQDEAHRDLITDDFRGNWSMTGGGDECSSFVESKREDGELVWTKATQGIVLGGLYAGYVFLHVPAQRIIQHLGCKRTGLLATLLMSLLTMTIPTASRLSPWVMTAIRVLQGLLSALGVPAVYCMWGAWAPPKERTTLVSICFSGGSIASAIVYPTSGFLCTHGFAGGWPSVFYVYGMVGLFWCGLWQVLMYETPDEHPRIDPGERDYINHSIGPARAGNQGAVPWKKLLTSFPVWAVVMGNLCYNWPFFMLLAVLPQYMKEVLRFNIESNGIYSMLPYLSLFLCVNIWGYICDRIGARQCLSTTAVRKLSTVIGTLIPDILYVVVSFLDCSQALIAVVLMSTAIGISGTNMQGYLINPYDIAPKYATAILCLSNTVSVATGIVSPYIVASLTVDKTREQWQLVFFLTSGLGIACMIFYLIFGSGVQMKWTLEEKGGKEGGINDPRLNFEVIIPEITDDTDISKERDELILSGADESESLFQRNVST